MAQARRNKKNKTPVWIWFVMGVFLGFFLAHVDFLATYQLVVASVEKMQTSTQSSAVPSHAQKEETQFQFYSILTGESNDSSVRAKQTKSQQTRKTQRQQALGNLSQDDAGFSGAVKLQKKRTTQELSDLDAPIHRPRTAVSQTRAVMQLPTLSQQKKSSVAAVQSQTSEMVLEKPKSADSSKKFALQIAAVRTYADADRLKAQLLLMGFQDIRIQKVMKEKAEWFRVVVGHYSTRGEAESAKKRLKQNHVDGFIVIK